MTVLSLSRLFDASLQASRTRPRLSWARDVEPFHCPEEEVWGFTARVDDTFLVAFAATKTRGNWFTNFTFPKKVVPYLGTNPRIRVHRGWLAAYKTSVRAIVLGRAQRSGCRKMVVTGFSMGGALAVLSAVDLQYNLGVEVASVTFGAPRVGNRRFRDSFNRRVPDSIRVINGGDIVTRVPPWILGFRHTGTADRFGPSCPLRVSVRDHLPERYGDSIHEG